VFANPELRLPEAPVNLYHHAAGFFLFISQLQLSFSYMQSSFGSIHRFQYGIFKNIRTYFFKRKARRAKAVVT